jgi:hypothetical protein
VLHVGVLEEANGEGGWFNTTTNPNGMPNLTIDLGDSMALIIFDVTEKVVQKAQGGFNPMGKYAGPSFNPSFLDILQDAMIGVDSTRPDADDLLNKVLSDALLSKCEKQGSISIPMEFFSSV